MRKILTAALLAGALSLVVGRVARAQDTPGPSVTGPTEHRTQAVKRTMAAIDAGKDGSATGAADHAKQALTHAQAARKDQPADEKLTGAIKNLEDAVAKGRSGDKEGATKAAEEALQKLQPK